MAQAVSADSIPTHKALYLALPGIHCGGCISAVERALLAEPGVNSARVNLTLKRATIEANTGVEPRQLVDALARAGYEARELDGVALSATETDKQGRALLMRL
ncbi:MAG: heavy-metal-associated domain-containing protein, partial [Marinosulfonomonas sp.]|nr:heavy-metal-associated domain-containing protein [Marinosulfonomonas sp.]